MQPLLQEPAHADSAPDPYYTQDDADVTLMILSMFIVAKAILEVYSRFCLQELNVIRSALLLLCLERQQ